MSLPERVLFVKAAPHVDEDLSDLIERKRVEAERAGGACFWGYGGSVGHPTRQVQPFAAGRGRPVTCLFMVARSRSFNRLAPADELSVDGEAWAPVPGRVKISGSKWALVLAGLELVELQVPLDEYAVALGPSVGMPVSRYLRGRTAKACAVHVGPGRDVEPAPREIVMRARLVPPYAVFVRRHPTPPA